MESHPELQRLLDDFVTAVITHKPTDLINFGLYFFNNVRSNGKFGPCPIIIAGPSGVGKGTIINRLMTTYPEIFGFSVSHTTRAPRPGEIDGVHYNFVTKGEFEEAIERGDFVEYAKVHTNFYGTSFQAIEKVMLSMFSIFILSFVYISIYLLVRRFDLKIKYVSLISIFKAYKTSKSRSLIVNFCL